MNLRSQDLKTIREVLRGLPAVQQVKIFGSRANDTARRASDLDLAILAPDATPTQWAEICAALENAPLIYDLDIVRLDQTVNPRLRDKVLREGILVYPEQKAA